MVICQRQNQKFGPALIRYGSWLCLIGLLPIALVLLFCLVLSRLRFSPGMKMKGQKKLLLVFVSAKAQQ